jgi:beta-galactosidase
VIDEAFDKWNRHFTRDWEKDLRAMLVRDRNHPSIVLWSVGNENGMVWSDAQLQTYRRLARVVREEDPTRPVSAALRPAYPPKEDPTPRGLVSQMLPMVDALDVVCLNYQEHLYQELRRARPEVVIIGSECHLYFRGEGVRYKSGNERNPWFDVGENGYVAGQFLWTGIDYLGESEGWPAKGKANSLMETTGFRKDCSYWHQSVWSDKPMVHIAVFDDAMEDYPQKKYWHWPKIRSHWNFSGKEGVMLRLVTYSNCDTVELLLNGRSLGIRKPVDFPNRAAVWEVAYEPGELKAVGRKAGSPVAGWTLKTAGPAARITLRPDRTRMQANGRDVAHVEIRVEDEQGVLVPDAKLPLSFSAEGACRLIGLDNGDLRANESFKATKRTTWRGRSLAVIQAARTAGDASLRVTAPGFPEASSRWQVTDDRVTGTKSEFQFPH